MTDIQEKSYHGNKWMPAMLPKTQGLQPVKMWALVWNNEIIPMPSGLQLIYSREEDVLHEKERKIDAVKIVPILITTFPRELPDEWMKERSNLLAAAQKEADKVQDLTKELATSEADRKDAEKWVRTYQDRIKELEGREKFYQEVLERREREVHYALTTADELKTRIRELERNGNAHKKMEEER